jgi:hypothetical protein
MNRQYASLRLSNQRPGIWKKSSRAKLLFGELILLRYLLFWSIIRILMFPIHPQKKHRAWPSRDVKWKFQKNLSNGLSNQACAFRCSMSRNCISQTGGGDSFCLSLPNWPFQNFNFWFFRVLSAESKILKQKRFCIIRKASPEPDTKK